jgi:hypothetical protein
MTCPQTVVNSPRRWFIPSANAASVTAWLCPSSTLVCQPLSRRRLGADGAAVVGITPCLLVVAALWWAGLVAVGGRQATGPAMATDGRHDHGPVLPKR